MTNYVWTKKAEETSAKYGNVRKEGDPATYGHKPVGLFGIAQQWLKKGVYKV